MRTDGLLGVEHKSIPPELWGRPENDLVGRRVSELATPILTIDESALDHNERTMFAWAAEQGLELAPHGKTTMAPGLWRRLLDRGAWGITVATPWQAQVAHAEGASTVLLADPLLDPVGLRWVGRALEDPGFRFVCWADDVAVVDAMAAALAATPPARPVEVLVELGAPSGRTGARSLDEARVVARAIDAAPQLRLAGVGGYESALAADRAEASLDRVRRYLDDLAVLATELWVDGRPLVSAGGSTHFDLVAERFGGRADATVVLRSGAFQLHDDGLYGRVSPFAGTERRFRAAIHVWSRVLSQPEAGLALLDAGRRDVSFDQDLPVPQRLLVDGGPVGGTLSALADQHAFLRADRPPAVGTVVRLGLSHPCGVLDRWRLIPLIGDADEPDPVITGVVRTFF